MQHLKRYQNLWISLFLGVYLLMALFVANIHHHDSGLVFKDFHFKKTEKTVSQSDFSQGFTDCLSCHVMHDGKNLVPQDFSVSFYQENYFHQQNFAYQQKFSSVQHDVLTLRGPPIF